ncbi:putative ribonuclease H protein, partial [Trifolium medium]|nr:putative ribonuclease H protein [Trifolium medium]
GVSKVLGNGNMTSFWNDTWVGDQPLGLRFPRLFSMSLQQQENVYQMGRMELGGWRWNLIWRRNFFSWETSIYDQFLAVIDEFQPVDQEDSWQWRADPSVGFTAKSVYFILITLQRPAVQLNQ